MEQQFFSSQFIISFLMLITACGGIVNAAEAGDVISLPNAPCIPRETVVSIDAPRFAKKPSKVILNRCDGSFGEVTPSLKKCVANTSEHIKLRVQNIFTLQSEILDLENHTSCQHQCIFNGSQCNKFQKWDSDNCHCTCNHNIQHNCPDHYMWEPNLCQCVCNRECPLRRQYLDEDECSCTCKPKFFKRCNRKGKVLVESNCTCIAPKSPLALHECNIIPTKWAVLIIVLSFFAIFIIAFDCILYARKTGCIFQTTHLCYKKSPQMKNDERTPMKCHNNGEISAV